MIRTSPCVSYSHLGHNNLHNLQYDTSVTGIFYQCNQSHHEQYETIIYCTVICDKHLYARSCWDEPTVALKDLQENRADAYILFWAEDELTLCNNNWMWWKRSLFKEMINIQTGFWSFSRNVNLCKLISFYINWINKEMKHRVQELLKAHRQSWKETQCLLKENPPVRNVISCHSKRAGVRDFRFFRDRLERRKVGVQISFLRHSRSFKSFWFLCDNKTVESISFHAQVLPKVVTSPPSNNHRNSNENLKNGTDSWLTNTYKGG